MKASFVSCALALLTLFASGCAKGGKFNDPLLPMDAIYGQEFQLYLPSNPTTGFKWELAKPVDAAKLQFVRSEYMRTTKADPKTVGEGDTECWTFRAIGVGQAAISMRYVRPWEKNVAPAQSVVYTINVRL